MSIELPEVITECFGDTLMIKKVLGKSVNHISTNGQIANYLAKRKDDNKIIIAITDHDKELPKKFSELRFKEVVGYSNPMLSLHHRPKSKHYIIFIKPALEKWILKCCDEVNYDKRKYPFLNNLKSMTDSFKNKNIGSNVEISSFLKELVKLNPPSMKILKSWIEEKLKK